MKNLAAIARSQHGAFSVHQARALGVSRQALETMRTKGLIERRFRGVYVFVGGEPGHMQWMHAALLWAGAGGVLSHTSAAWLHGLDIDPGMPELTLPHSRPRPPGVRVHRAALERTHIVKVNRLAVTGIPRTVLDLCGVDATLAEAFLDDALRSNATTLKACGAFLSSIGGRGVAGTRPMRLLIDRRMTERGRVDSRMERRFAKLMDSCGIPKPVFQHRVRINGESYRLDFAYPELKLGIEIDSWKYHSGRLAWDKDLQRRNQLTVEGWTLLHITSEQIMNRPDEVTFMMECAYHDLMSKTPIILGEVTQALPS